MITARRFVLCLVCSALLVLSCKKADDQRTPTGPAELILGEWILTEGRLLEIEGTDTNRASYPGVAGDKVVFNNQQQVVFYDKGTATSPQPYTIHSGAELEISGLRLQVLTLDSGNLVFEKHDTDPQIPGSFYQYTWVYRR